MKGKNEEREGMEGRKEGTNKRLFFLTATTATARTRTRTQLHISKAGGRERGLGLGYWG